MSKRKLNDDCDNPTTTQKEKEIVFKKQKLDNFHDQEAVTTPPETQENLEERNATTPGPIKTFLGGFKFKVKIKNQDTLTHSIPQKPATPPKKKIETEKELFMSKFSRLKSKFEKEKVKSGKSCNKVE